MNHLVETPMSEQMSLESNPLALNADLVTEATLVDVNPEPEGTTPSDQRDHSTASEKEKKSWEERRQKMRKVVDVKWSNFQHFKNRYGLDEGLEIIEVLQGHQNIGQEVSQERSRRVPLKRWGPRTEPKIADATSTWIHRVRIQSSSLLLLLSRLTGNKDEWSIDTPRVFTRPFKTFYYFLPQMKKCLTILEENWARNDGQGDLDFLGEEQPLSVQANGAPSGDHNVSKGKEKPCHDSGSDSSSDISSDDESLDEFETMEPEVAVSGPIANSPTALEHTRKYVEFVEENITPLWERAAGTNQRKVRWRDLWMYYQAGGLLYVPPASDPSKLSGSTRPSATTGLYQNVWQLYSLYIAGIRDENLEDIHADLKQELCLFTYYIDYDGSSCGLVGRIFWIEAYEGERDITTLGIYPMRFDKDFEKLQTKFRSRGARFQEAVRKKHVYYDGWTLTHGPTSASDSDTRRNSEHIDGDVIIDFEEGFKADSSLKEPSFNAIEVFHENKWPEIEDSLSIRHWDDFGSKKSLMMETRELVQRNELLSNYLKKRHGKKCEFVKALQKNGHAAQVELEQVKGDDLLLLPCRMVAYALRERKFVMVDIDAITPVPEPQNVFRDLKIDKEHKRLVKSLVKMHFQKREVQKQTPIIGLNQDLIRGKGTGLIILLHGAPGVGKTATAEAVAQAHKKPLFVITSGDLGSTPREVETNLRDIFRLAHLWDCVLLLDEADVFLSKRQISDLKRNALVSVLFLTTNRVGDLDEGFRSRVSIALYYKHLTKEQTLAIFKVNLQKLHAIEEGKQAQQHEKSIEVPNYHVRPLLDIDDQSILNFAARHFDDNERAKRWNGRQIVNAFQVAYSLAHFDMQKISLEKWNEDENEDCSLAKPTQKLDYKQFDTVALTIRKFDFYLYDTAAGDAGDLARIQGIRADDHDPNAHYTSLQQAAQRKVYPPMSRHYQQDFDLLPNSTFGNDPEAEILSSRQSSLHVPKNYQSRFSQPKERQALHEQPQRTIKTRVPQYVSPVETAHSSRLPYHQQGDSGYSGWTQSPKEEGHRLGEDEYVAEEVREEQDCEEAPEVY